MKRAHRLTIIVILGMGLALLLMRGSELPFAGLQRAWPALVEILLVLIIVAGIVGAVVFVRARNADRSDG